MVKEDVVNAALKSLEGLLELVESGSATKEDVQAAVAMSYRLLVGKYVPIIQALPTTLPIVGEDLARVVSGFINLLSTMSENSELNQAMTRLRKNRARGTFENYLAYREAGFGRIASVMFTLADKKSPPLAPKLNTPKSND